MGIGPCHCLVLRSHAKCESFLLDCTSVGQVAAELARVAPIQLLRPNMQPWKGGVLSLDPVVERLRQLLPATFEELPVPLAVGVVDQTGKHVLIKSGPLPEAVAASAAIPMMFAAVDIPGELPTAVL